MRRLFITLVVGMVLLGVAPGSKASVMDKKTLLTFSGPVEVPGMVLSAGTYVFKRVDPGMPNIVRILNADETQVYATLMAIPIERRTAAEKPEVTFEERRGPAPEALQTWFYPGEITGEQFIYPKGTKIVTPASSEVASSETVPSNNLSQNEEEPAYPHYDEVAQATPPNGQSSMPLSTSGQRSTTAPQAPQAQQTNPPASARQSTTSADQDTNTQETLPQTAGPLALLVLMGAGALAGGAGLKMFARPKK